MQYVIMSQTEVCCVQKKMLFFSLFSKEKSLFLESEADKLCLCLWIQYSAKLSEKGHCFVNIVVESGPLNCEKLQKQ